MMGKICEKLFFNLGQWFRRRRCLKIFLFLALVAILFSTAELFVQFWWRQLRNISFGPVVQEEMLLKDIS